EAKVLPALEDAVEEGLGELGVVEDLVPTLERLVGREDDRTSLEAPLIDDAVEDVGGVAGALEVADLVDDEDVRMHVRGCGVTEGAVARGGVELVDQVGGGDEASFEAVLDRLVGERDGEVRLAAARLAGEDQVAALGDELRPEVGPELLAPE